MANGRRVLFEPPSHLTAVHNRLNYKDLLTAQVEAQLLFHICVEAARRHASAHGAIVVAFSKLTLRFMLIVTTGLALFAVAPGCRAQVGGIAGKYECAHVKVHGKLKPCSSAQLTLKNDGRFELRGWEGEYVVSGEYVELSDKSLKSKAKLEPGFKLVFRYHGKNGIVEVTYERRLRAPGGEALS